jgi:O-antigen ligase
LPLVIRNARTLVTNPMVVAVVIFAAIQWACAFIAVDFGANTVKAALRYSAGAWLVCAFVTLGDRRQLLKTWSIASIVAAAYALVDYAGHGFPSLFREMEFYFHDVQRLSGSFEYANTAAAYFAISLPIVWMTVRNNIIRVGGAALLWSVLVLTFSRGAFVAVFLVLAIWYAVSRSVKPLQLGALGLLTYFAFAIHLPVLVERATGTTVPPMIRAEYLVEFNHLSERPGSVIEMPVVLRNSSLDAWHSQGERQVTLAYHWYHTGEKRIVDVRSIETPIPHDVGGNQSITVKARAATPDVPGFYLLSWDMKINGEWFSKAGVSVTAVEADIRPDADGARSNVDISKWFGRKRGVGRVAAADLPRKQLWSAAITLAKSNPIFGVGPDNFRMMYGSTLGFGKWDTNIRSNSLYLELLVGSGIAGLCAFLYVVSRIRWRATPASLALGVSLAHGIVDFFLMTTPIYFGFWLLIGCVSGGADESRV